jgi:hypothetical protein
VTVHLTNVAIISLAVGICPCLKGGMNGFEVLPFGVVHKTTGRVPVAFSGHSGITKGRCARASRVHHI